MFGQIELSAAEEIKLEVRGLLSGQGMRPPAARGQQRASHGDDGE